MKTNAKRVIVGMSGGVDSSLVVRETVRNQPAVQCFSVGYREEKYSELPAARAAAAALGVLRCDRRIHEKLGRN